MADHGNAAPQGDDRIVVRGLRLWAHVGVLEAERQLGQWFELDLELLWTVGAAAAADDLTRTLDYSRAIVALQLQARTVRCLTLEHWSERIFVLLEELYGAVPMAIELRKCRAPVPGFSGTVALRRRRHWPDITDPLTTFR
ncbi:MAG: dihydroneopterin aldolase [Cyanobacteriota bacterium]|jgi:dihydroneopterin aldolase